MDINTIAWISLVFAFICALAILIDVIRFPQKMWIMNIVWPVTALYSGPLALLAYYKIGRLSAKKENESSHHHGHPQKPYWQSIVVAALHCGSGCTLGDILAQAFLSIVPVVLFGRKLFGDWAIAYVFAFALGIIFQYYSIKPMKHLSSKQALIAALKADTLSLTAWQIGMYGWMAIAIFLIYNHPLNASTPLFWLMMQIAMLLGFVTAYPVNWWLVKKGIKEKM
ncbi:MAG: DUF4396 domain-containing protein [Ginsengibacter sp.]